ncbi:MAG TPA: glycoside hydrolase family 15 protein [Vicinamibacterales bacterium]|nr:glycoside hydrolase family 15 protein [Vicinamibacterales bacterium]
MRAGEITPIRDYAAIGDGRTVALVGRHGSIDWLCWPRFDSPSIFGAILDEQGGCWSLAPTTVSRVARRYVDDTNVLETRFDTDAGTLVVTDLMPVASEDDKRRLLLPDHEILRVGECVAGEVEVEMRFTPRPNYGRPPGRVRHAGSLGVRVETGADLLVLRSDLPLDITADGTVRGRTRLRAGDAVHASLTFADDWPAVLPPLGEWSRAAIARSVTWWRDWASRLRYDGPRREMVIRSALALKLLVYAPSGAVVAAPTTSLPERIGGDLNWDYRFCWLRDAAFTVRALFALGCVPEAHAFVDWLLHATRLTQPELRVLYDVYGNAPADERVLEHLAGYAGSRPVRIGNGAAGQRQLDVYGEVIDAVAHFVGAGGALDRDTERTLCAFGEYVCRHWREPDEGIWEPRSGAAHNTHSRMLCWTALDRLLLLHSQGYLGRAPAAMFQKNRALIRREIDARAWHPGLGSYVAQLDGDRLDATLLLLPWYGFEDAGTDRMRGTYVRVREALGAGEGLLYRYRTADSPGEGAFGICSFWGAEFLALGGGTPEAARDVFERLCGYANDVGLFAEEIDPATGAALGNFPQAFSHVGLINAAVSLARRLEGAPPMERRLPPPASKAEQPEVRV